MAEEWRVREKHVTRDTGEEGDQRRPAVAKLTCQRPEDDDHIGQMQQGHRRMVGTDIERMERQPALQGLGRHLDPGHQRAAIEEVEGAQAEEISRVADGAETVVVLNLHEHGGRKQPGGNDAMTTSAAIRADGVFVIAARSKVIRSRPLRRAASLQIWYPGADALP